MNPWLILGIKETDDKNKVKEAYMSLLGKFNPEDDPEGFQNLRLAYESALKQIDENAKEKPTDPVSVFMGKFEGIYKDFKKRVDIDSWKELLQDDICTNLEKEDELNNRILEFLMANFYLPTDVWRLFDSKFNWAAMEKELSKRIHPGFIGFVIHNIKSEPTFDYHLFEISAEKDYDRFLFLYWELQRHLDERLEGDTEGMMAEIEALEINHPNYILEKARYTAHAKDPDEALEMFENLLQGYDNTFRDNPYVTFIRSCILLAFKEDPGKIKLAADAARKLLEANPEYYFAQVNLIEAYKLMQNDEEGFEFIVDEALPVYPSNAFFMSCAISFVHGLKEKYEKKHLETPDDDDIIISLVKFNSYLYQYEEASGLLPKLKDKSTAEYFTGLAQVESGLFNHEKAAEAALFAIEIEPTYGRYDMLIYSLIELKKYEEAIAHADIAVSEVYSEKGYERVKKADIFKQKGVALSKLLQYDNALLAIDRAIEIHDRVFSFYSAKAEIYKSIGNYSEAAHFAEISMGMFPYVPLPYEILAEIYCMTDNFEQMDEIIESAKRYEVKSHGFSYFKALEFSRNEKFNESLELLKTLAESENLGAWEEKIITEIAYLYEIFGDDENAAYEWRKCIDKNPEDEVGYNRMAMALERLGKIEEALEIIRLGLENIPESVNLLIRKGFILKNSKRDKEALELFLYAIDHIGDGVWWNIADLYEEAGRIYFGSLNDAENALKYFHLVLEHESSRALTNFYLGDIDFFYFNDPENAIKRYSAAIEADENDYASYYARGYVREKQGQADLAAADYKKAIEICTKEPINYHGLHRYIAQAYIGLGDLGAAKKSLKKALEMLNTDGTHGGECYCVFQGYALYYIAGGKYDKALENIGLAIRLADSVKNNALKNEILAHLPPGSDSKICKDDNIRPAILGLCKSLRGNSDFYLFEDIPQQKLDNAVKSYVLPLDPDEGIIFLYDNTRMGSAKDGLVLTTKRLCGKNQMSSGKSIAVKDITKIEFQASVFGTTIIVRGRGKDVIALVIRKMFEDEAQEFTNMLEKAVDLLRTSNTKEGNFNADNRN